MIPIIFGSLDFQLEKIKSEQMKNFLGDKNMPISTVLSTKIRLTMLCLSGFEHYSRWVPLLVALEMYKA